MNVLFLPGYESREADGVAEAQIRALGMEPVPRDLPVTFEAVVLVAGADRASYMTAGVYLGRNYPVAIFEPGAEREFEGETLFHAITAIELRNWLDDIFTSAMRITPHERPTTKKGVRS